MKRKKNFLNYIKRAVFTVEAAFIVPMTVTVTVLLMGLCYYTHQSNWCKGVSAEAVLYSLQRSNISDKAALINERLENRLKEAPLNTGDVLTTASEGTKYAVHYESKVLPDVFNDAFEFSNESSVVITKPLMVKRITFIASAALREEE